MRAPELHFNEGGDDELTQWELYYCCMRTLEAPIEASVQVANTLTKTEGKAPDDEEQMAERFKRWIKTTGEKSIESLIKSLKEKGMNLISNGKHSMVIITPPGTHLDIKLGDDGKPIFPPGVKVKETKQFDDGLIQGSYFKGTAIGNAASHKGWGIGKYPKPFIECSHHPGPQRGYVICKHLTESHKQPKHILFAADDKANGIGELLCPECSAMEPESRDIEDYSVTCEGCAIQQGLLPNLLERN